jgi:predicted DNA binding CopG/RHH family protein
MKIRKGFSALSQGLPALNQDGKAEKFEESADLTRALLAEMAPLGLGFTPKAARVNVNMSLPKPLLDSIKATAARRGIPHQRFIRETLERAIDPTAA